MVVVVVVVVVVGVCVCVEGLGGGLVSPRDTRPQSGPKTRGGCSSKWKFPVLLRLGARAAVRGLQSSGGMRTYGEQVRWVCFAMEVTGCETAKDAPRMSIGTTSASSLAQCLRFSSFVRKNVQNARHQEWERNVRSNSVKFSIVAEVLGSFSHPNWCTSSVDRRTFLVVLCSFVSSFEANTMKSEIFSSFQDVAGWWATLVLQHVEVRCSAQWRVLPLRGR